MTMYMCVSLQKGSNVYLWTPTESGGFHVVKWRLYMYLLAIDRVNLRLLLYFFNYTHKYFILWCLFFTVQLMRKMSIYSPPKMLVENYMVEIAKSFNVEFTPDPIALLVSVTKSLIVAQWIFDI